MTRAGVNPHGARLIPRAPYRPDHQASSPRLSPLGDSHIVGFSVPERDDDDEDGPFLRPGRQS